MAKQALGKGLGALIGRPAAKKASQASKSKKGSKAGAPAQPAADIAKGDVVQHVELDQIVSSPLQPRVHFREEHIDELVESIREHGVIQPLIVREVDGKYELIAGERRWRASSKLGMTELPVIVRDASDQEVLEMALIENLQREDLDPIEEATAYRRLAKDFTMKQEDIARRVGKSRAAVANAIRLLDLNGDVQDLLSSGRITIGHAKVILGVKNKEEQMLIAEKVVKKSMTVRQVEKLVSDHLNGVVGKKNVTTSSKLAGQGNVAQVSAAIARLENRLRDRFATQVAIQHGDKKGVITLEYYGNEDLERILDLMGAGD